MKESSSRKLSVKWQMGIRKISEEEAVKIVEYIKEYGVNPPKPINKNPYDFKWIMYNDCCSEEEAKEIVKLNYRKHSNRCIEFWIEKGFTEEDAKNEIKKNQSKLGKKANIAKKNISNYFENTQIGYWLKKGYSEEESKIKVSERQATFSLDKCIEKYGKEEGTKIWQERQIKWQETLEDKPQEEIDKINRSKGKTFDYFVDKYGLKYAEDLWKKKIDAFYKGINNISSVSKISTKFFDLIDLEGNLKINREFKISMPYSDKKYSLYSVDGVYDNKGIEFYGDFWHANPKKYKPNWVNIRTKLTAQEIWEKDEKRFKHLEKNLYKLKIVWESEFIENPKKVIEECLQFLLKENNE